ncbi:cysteine hydrolase family protein [Mucilaginibacter antarcticus]|uniref:Cysteine hydrolase family protein n=1 Tax=Mucilaginibacter antarcticus TaxID=1855725 RepID=A0ABW5XQZ2_9SPHI
MQTLVIIDAQNEFSDEGQRPVPEFSMALDAIKKRIEKARYNQSPIAWVRHFNKLNESPAFIPGTWGSDFLTGLGPDAGSNLEKEFHKEVYGAFTGSDLGEWLKEIGCDEILLTGFYTHGCVSTTAREGIMRDYIVRIDPNATGTIAIENDYLGSITAADSKLSSDILDLICKLTYK